MNSMMLKMKFSIRQLNSLCKSLNIARYTPLLLLQWPYIHRSTRKQSQRNMGKFMKILLVKRLESSFFAFKNSIGRFIHSYEMFIKEFEKGNVYVSKNILIRFLSY